MEPVIFGKPHFGLKYTRSAKCYQKCVVDGVYCLTYRQRKNELYQKAVRSPYPGTVATILGIPTIRSIPQAVICPIHNMEPLF